MTWKSAGEIFDPIAAALIELGASDEVKRRVLGPLIVTLQDQDWGTEDYSLEKFRNDPVIVGLFAERGVRLEDSFDAYVLIAEDEASRVRGIGQSRGQIFFNLLMTRRPDLAGPLRGTDVDPFHNDGRIPEFLRRVEAAW